MNNKKLHTDGFHPADAGDPVYGSIATPVNPDKKPPNLPMDHTHQWTVSVKGVNDADISHFIKKVQFKLHDTYANPLRS